MNSCGMARIISSSVRSGVGLGYVAIISSSGGKYVRGRDKLHKTTLHFQASGQWCRRSLGAVTELQNGNDRNVLELPSPINDLAKKRYLTRYIASSSKASYGRARNSLSRNGKEVGRL